MYVFHDCTILPPLTTIDWITFLHETGSSKKKVDVQLFGILGKKFMSFFVSKSN